MQITVTPEHIKQGEPQDEYPEIECQIRGSLIDGEMVYEIVIVETGTVIMIGDKAHMTTFLRRDNWIIGDIIYW